MKIDIVNRMICEKKKICVLDQKKKKTLEIDVRAMLNVTLNNMK